MKKNRIKSYEQDKEKLRKKNLSPEAYQKEAKRLAQKHKV